jgi:hypothetical protein
MVTPMASRWQLLLLCFLAAAPRALVAFSPVASARPSLPASRSGVCLGWRTRAAGVVPLHAVNLAGRVASAEKGTRKSAGYGEISVTTEGELDKLLASGVQLEQLRVEGAVTGGKTQADHPVLKILEDRRASGSRTRP